MTQSLGQPCEFHLRRAERRAAAQFGAVTHSARVTSTCIHVGGLEGELEDEKLLERLFAAFGQARPRPPLRCVSAGKSSACVAHTPALD